MLGCTAPVYLLSTPSTPHTWSLWPGLLEKVDRIRSPILGRLSKLGGPYF